jgi:hypothetical protein|nr:hypothetical protein [uncultured Acetatifactor sp.]
MKTTKIPASLAAKAGAPGCACLSDDRNLDLHNGILNLVNDIFIDAHFIGKSV